MKKRIITVFLVLAMLTSITVYAVEARASVIPSLDFSLSRAECSVAITALDDYIDATLTLWDGDDPIASWEDAGYDMLYIEGSCSVTRRRTYTLEVTGTIGGVPFSDSITRTCS